MTDLPIPSTPLRELALWRALIRQPGMLERVLAQESAGLSDLLALDIRTPLRDQIPCTPAAPARPLSFVMEETVQIVREPGALDDAFTHVEPGAFAAMMDQTFERLHQDLVRQEEALIREATYQVPPAPVLYLTGNRYDPATESAFVGYAWKAPSLPPGRQIVRYSIQVTVPLPFGPTYTHDVPGIQRTFMDRLPPGQPASIVVYAQDDRGGWSAASNRRELQTAGQPVDRAGHYYLDAEGRMHYGRPQAPDPVAIRAVHDDLVELGRPCRTVAEPPQTRAHRLLLSLLTAEQRADYARNHTFRVRGSIGGRYEIQYGVSGNVHERLPDGSVISWCAAPRGGLPVEDVLAAQLLHLRTDEAGFRRVANPGALYRGPLLHGLDGRRLAHLVAEIWEATGAPLDQIYAAARRHPCSLLGLHMDVRAGRRLTAVVSLTARGGSCRRAARRAHARQVKHRRT